jgi:phosphoribosylformylglycinamidine (FGAM) synthase-like amidotransferase family enzyme
MAEYAPIFERSPFTGTTSATVTAGTLLEVSATGTVGPAGANSLKVVGVAAFDAASGAQVAIHRAGVQELVASGGVTAGDVLVAAAAGQVSTLAAVTTPTPADVTNTRAIVGVALTTATTGNKVQVLLKI